jgi:hypothetical protein
MGNLAAEQTVRTREYLTQREIDKLMDAARSGSRYGHRDSTMILIAYRHGERAATASRSPALSLEACSVNVARSETRS